MMSSFYLNHYIITCLIRLSEISVKVGVRPLPRRLWERLGLTGKEIYLTHTVNANKTTTSILLVYYQYTTSIFIVIAYTTFIAQYTTRITQYISVYYSYYSVYLSILLSKLLTSYNGGSLGCVWKPFPAHFPMQLRP